MPDNGVPKKQPEEKAHCARYLYYLDGVVSTVLVESASVMVAYSVPHDA